MPYISCSIPFGTTWVGLAELFIGVGKHVINEWENGLGLGEHGLELGRSQGQIPPIVLLHLIGAKKVGAKLFFLLFSVVLEVWAMVYIFFSL